MYQKGTDCCVWGKLYRKEVLASIRFPEGKIYEDLSVMCHILEQADHVVFTDYQGYHYLQRENSIIRAKFSESKMSVVDFAEENEAFSWLTPEEIAGQAAIPTAYRQFL